MKKYLNTISSYEQKWVEDQFLPNTYLFRTLVSIIQ